MKRIYYCKQNVLLYVVIGIALLIPLLLSALNHQDYFSISYLITYVSIVFLIMGAFVLAVSSAHVSLSNDNVVFHFIGIPFKHISVNSISEVESADKPQVHLFALSKEQIAVSCDNNRVINLSLYQNDDFVQQLKQLKASKSLSQAGGLQTVQMKTVLFVIMLFYMIANAFLPSIIDSMRAYSLLVFIMMSGANIICLVFYMNTRRNLC